MSDVNSVLNVKFDLIVKNSNRFPHHPRCEGRASQGNFDYSPLLRCPHHPECNCSAQAREQRARAQRENKKKRKKEDLLRERNRHTDCGVSSTPICCPIGGGEVPWSGVSTLGTPCPLSELAGG